MRFVLNAMGLVAWALSAFVLFAGVAVISESEPGTTEYMIANANFDASLPMIGFGLMFGLGCFFVGALIKRRS